MSMTEEIKNIKHLMIDADANQSMIASHFGWSDGYVSQLLRGGSLGPAAQSNKQMIAEWLEIKINGGNQDD